MEKKKKTSAGILAYEFVNGELLVLLGHPGGSFWAKRDEGIWSIPKGEFDSGEEAPLEAARREFAEETGTMLDGDFAPLAPVRQKNGKVVYAFAKQCDIDTTTAHSNTFEMEWPPKSGRMMRFPELDKLEWMPVAKASAKILRYQLPLLSGLTDELKKAQI